MKKCIVIGGGLAGLSAAVFLSDLGFHIELIEASPKLGGRTYSLRDKATDDEIDNGQHIMMGCYKDTLKFIKLINAGDNFIFQKKLKVNFIKENFRLYPLESVTSVYPFNLLIALLKYKAVSFKDRLSLLNFFIKILLIPGDRLNNITIKEWLIRENQNEALIKSFWEILGVGTLNTSIEKASAKIFSDILKKMFFSGNKSSTIILPRFGLSETFCKNSQKFVEEKGGRISVLESVTGLKISDEKIVSVKTNRREIADFNYVVSAVPYYNLKNILGKDLNILTRQEFQYSTIIAIHIWLSENNLKEEFYGLINSPVHWVFNHKSHLTLVISDANELAEIPKEKLFETALEELDKYLLLSKSRITAYKVIKEKRATFIPSNNILKNRPDAGTILNNFFLAGDWVNTGLPSTIESAVRSGRMVSEMISKKSII
jgi:squalene-associated FAD-dependent desaturase